MNRPPPITLLLLFLATGFLLASDTNRMEPDEPDEPVPALESEAKGIIPDGGLTVSTQAITPITMVPEKNSYDQALEELAVAQDLSKKGRVEAASDVALQAYDDLMAVQSPRRNKTKRKKLHAERRQAATFYTETSLLYIREFVNKAGNTPEAESEGRARVSDLRDVAINYPDLNRKVSAALEQYAVAPSSPVAR